jgi:hypothetical protein
MTEQHDPSQEPQAGSPPASPPPASATRSDDGQHAPGHTTSPTVAGGHAGGHAAHGGPELEGTADVVRETPRARAPDAPPERHRRDPLPVLLVLGVVVLIAAVVFVWLHPLGTRSAPPAVAPQAEAIDSSRITALERQVQGLQQRLSALEQRPLPSAPAPDLSPIEQRLAALEQRPAPPAPDLSGLTARQQSGDDTTANRLATDEARLEAAERAARQVSDAADRAARQARIQAALAALNAGQPVGDVPDAPPALARFRTEAPPTQAALRLSFPDAAEAALAAAEPDTSKESFWSAMGTRAESLITVRRGAHVLIGSPVSSLIAEARERLEAGDLAGAVGALGSLTGRPAQAMAGWLAQAHALLDARSALAALAARG